MRLRPLEGPPLLHENPRPVVSTEGPRVTVEVDDAQQRRVRLIFTPFQALRVTTEDCFRLPEGVEMVPRQVVVVAESPWLAELAAVLKWRDPNATFMERSQHFFIQAGDDFIEVAGWAVSWEGQQGSGRYPADPATAP